MIDIIAQWGEYWITHLVSDELEIYLSNNKLRNASHALCIILEKNDASYRYVGVRVEEIDNQNLNKYLYRFGSTRGTDATPASLFAGKYSKTFTNKILAWFKNRSSVFPNSIFSNIYKVLYAHKEEIIKELESKDVKTKKNILITIKIKENNVEKYIGEIQEFKDELLDYAYKRYYHFPSLGESKGYGICYICGREREVYGYVLPAIGFTFATADKPGFCPELKRTEYWKYIPICSECAKRLEAGKRFLDTYLSYKLYSMNYYLLPRVFEKKAFDEIYNLIEMYKDVDSYEEGLLSEEDYLIEVIGRKGIAALTFAFWQKKQSSYVDLKGIVEDVSPSWIKKIYIAQNEVKEEDIFSEETCKKVIRKNFSGTFIEGLRANKEQGMGKNNWYVFFIFEFSETDNIFLELISAILSGRPVKINLYGLYMRKIKKYFHENPRLFSEVVMKSLMLNEFLKKLNIISSKTSPIMSEASGIKKNFEEFFSKYKIPDEGKAYFAVGALVGYVLYVQRKERGSEMGKEPFRSKLFGLNLNSKRLKRIFTEAVLKLSEYQHSWPEFESLAGEYSLLASTGKMSQEEASYYFTLGMVLYPILVF